MQMVDSEAEKCTKSALISCVMKISLKLRSCFKTEKLKERLASVQQVSKS